MVKLSIIIPTLVTRRHFRERLVTEFRRQVQVFDLQGQIELLIYEDEYGTGLTTGAKRQACLEKAQGKYICCFDDDDRPAPNYLQKITEAIETTPDCITFEGKYSDNLGNSKKFYIQLGESWRETPKALYRPPHHLCAFRSDIAKRGSYPDKIIGEDVEYGRRVAPFLKTSVHIAEDLYFYEKVHGKKENGKVGKLQQPPTTEKPKYRNRRTGKITKR